MERGPNWLDEAAYDLLALLDTVDGGRSSLCLDCVVAMRPYDRATVEAATATLAKHDAVDREGSRVALAEEGRRLLRPQHEAPA